MEHSSSSRFQLPSSFSLSSNRNNDLFNLDSGTVIPFWAHSTLGLHIGSDSRVTKRDVDGNRIINNDQTCKNYCIGKEYDFQIFFAGSNYVASQSAYYVYNKYKEIAATREINRLEDFTENIFIPSAKEAYEKELPHLKCHWRPTHYVICNTSTSKTDGQFLDIEFMVIDHNLNYKLQAYGCIGSGSQFVPQDFSTLPSELSPDDDEVGLKKIVGAINHAISSDNICGGALEIYRYYKPQANGEYESEFLFDDCPSLCAKYGIKHLTPATKNLVEKPELLSFRRVLYPVTGTFP